MRKQDKCLASILAGSFTRQELCVPIGTGNYTPAQASSFYADASIPYASDLAPLFQGNMTPSNTSPGTHFYGFYGTGVRCGSLQSATS